jgi:hypothetical protein
LFPISQASNLSAGSEFTPDSEVAQPSDNKLSVEEVEVTHSDNPATLKEIIDSIEDSSEIEASKESEEQSVSNESMPLQHTDDQVSIENNNLTTNENKDRVDSSGCLPTNIGSGMEDDGYSPSSFIGNNEIANNPNADESITPSLNKEILFDDSMVTIQALNDGSDEAQKKLHGWTNKRWSSLQPRLQFFASVIKVEQEKKMFVWSTEKYNSRTLAIFHFGASTDTIMLILRDPIDADEVIRLLPVEKNLNPIARKETTVLTSSYLVAEHVVDPLTCKLRLSRLTTPTSIPIGTKKADSQKQAFFELLTPNGSISLSIVTPTSKNNPDESMPYGVDAIIETTKIEDAISNALFAAHSLVDGPEDKRAGTHQIVLGTLHSHIISGNDKVLQDALTNALHIQRSNGFDEHKLTRLDPSIVDARDLNWKTPLHYACERRRPTAISLLIHAGANCMKPSDEKMPLHICAEQLDDKCLSIILSATHPRPE